jgi:putative ABC transport system permease protein
MSVSFTEPVAQELMLGEQGAYTNINVRAADGVDPVALRDDIRAALGTRYDVKTGTELAQEQTDEFQQGLSFFNNILLGFAGVALFVGIFLILNTFSIIIAQRTRELALMRAIGASKHQMIGSVLAEAVAIGLVASALGLAAGVGVGALLAYAFARVGGGLELAGVGVPPAAVVSSFVVGILVTLVAAVLPALRAARIAPVAAMQDTATPDRPLTKITIAGAVTGAAGGGLLAYGLSGEAGDATLWTILGGVLVSFVGVALLTPLLSRPVVSLLGRLFSWSVPGKLGRLNSGRNPRRTAITAAALMVGIALITGVSVILDSTRTSFNKLADEQVQAEIFIDGEQSGARPPSFDPAVLESTAALPGVARSAGVYSDLALVNGEREWVVATEDVPDLAAIFSVRAQQGTVGPLRDDQFIVDSETAGELGLAAGDTARFQFSRGEERGYTVAAVYAKSDLYSGIVLPAAAAASFGVPQPVEAYLQLAPGTAVDSVLSRVNALLADNPEFSAVDRSAFLAEQTDELDTLLTMIQMLLGLAILIAVLGIVNTLALSVIERTRELGLLRAIGLRRGQTMRMITVEAIVISVFGALLGLAVGSGLGAAVVRALRSDGITELVLPWRQMGAYLVLAALVGVVAAVLPAIRAARLNVLGAIAHE